MKVNAAQGPTRDDNSFLDKPVSVKFKNILRFICETYRSNGYSNDLVEKGIDNLTIGDLLRSGAISNLTHPETQHPSFQKILLGSLRNNKRLDYLGLSDDEVKSIKEDLQLFFLDQHQHEGLTLLTIADLAHKTHNNPAQQDISRHTGGTGGDAKLTKELHALKVENQRLKKESGEREQVVDVLKRKLQASRSRLFDIFNSSLENSFLPMLKLPDYFKGMVGMIENGVKAVEAETINTPEWWSAIQNLKRIYNTRLFLDRSEDDNAIRGIKMDQVVKKIQSLFNPFQQISSRLETDSFRKLMRAFNPTINMDALQKQVTNDHRDVLDILIKTRKFLKDNPDAQNA